MHKLSYLSIKKNLYPLTLLGGVRGLQIFITTYSLHTGIYRLVPFLSKFFFNAISVGRIDPIKGIS